MAKGALQLHHSPHPLRPGTALRLGLVAAVLRRPHGTTVFNYRYCHDDNDIRRMRNKVRLSATILESDANKDTVEVRIVPTDEVLAKDETLDKWIRENVGSSRHLSGTCQIGPDSDPMAVVDRHCLVKGVTGLWVADSSIIPQVTRANTNATAIMIGERVAAWVASA